MSTAFLVLIVAASILLMLVRPRGIAEVWWVGAGAILLVVTGLVPLRHALRAVREGTDVYLFLIGMMLLSALGKTEKVFDWLASFAVRAARGSATRLFTIVYVIGICVTTLMSNDATAVVLTPAILIAVRKAKVDPTPHLYACAFIANAASFVLPISNPANLVVFRSKMPTLGHWASHFGLPSLLSVATTYVVLRAAFRKPLGDRFDAHVAADPLTRDGTWVVAGLGLVVAVMLVASTSGVDLGWPTCAAATFVTVLFCASRKRSPLELLRAVSWKTIALVAALFVLVEAMESVGAVRVATRLLAGVERLPSALGAALTGLTIAIANNAVNNLPLGLIIGATLKSRSTTALLQDVILIAVDLGPNLSITGSLATILWLLALRKEGVETGFWRFFKIGIFVMPLALLAAIGGVTLIAKY